MTRKMSRDQDKQHRAVIYNKTQRWSECGSWRWRTEMRSGRGRGGMENRGRNRENVCVCGREKMERGCGWMRRMLYIMAEVQE